MTRLWQRAPRDAAILDRPFEKVGFVLRRSSSLYFVVLPAPRTFVLIPRHAGDLGKCVEHPEHSGLHEVL